ncbi:hypothetical protein [Streptomyces sp. NPDC091215]|uniref:hypothetical protein n=1 Tax=Streptomyces sp. NPDC091215 TaxID=3155192 RepID=UPI0034236CD8
MDATAGLGGDFVRSVLHELEELPVAVSALGDPALPVRVFGDESRIDGVRLENAGGLIEHGIEHRLRFG